MAVWFIPEARTDQEKGELFPVCRQDNISSVDRATERMGVDI
ncbi:MAG: hypothetical protein ACRDSH_15990 [Pseudonocardiaceae bacterium]